MKKLYALIVLMMFSLLSQAQTWDEWVKQDKTQLKYLSQQIAKFQLYLACLKKGYSIVEKGLTVIGDIKDGDFKLHEDLFSRLGLVKTAVKKDPKVAAIHAMVKQMKAAALNCNRVTIEAGVYSTEERQFTERLLTNVLEKTADDLQNLTLVVSNRELEMTDAERADRIDKLHAAVSEKHLFLFSFCKQTGLHVRQRIAELDELKNLQKQY